MTFGEAVHGTCVVMSERERAKCISAPPQVLLLTVHGQT